MFKFLKRIEKNEDRYWELERKIHILEGDIKYLRESLHKINCTHPFSKRKIELKGSYGCYWYAEECELCGNTFQSFAFNESDEVDKRECEIKKLQIKEMEKEIKQKCKRKK